MHGLASRLPPVVLLACLAAGGSAVHAVQKYDTADVVLHSAAVYDGISGTPNPFTSVVLTLSVTAPDGRTFQVDGFFDGDGNGGAVGNVFKARIFLDQEGTWTWTSSSATAGLNGQSGQIQCSGLLSGIFSKGPLIKRGARPQYFAHADGAPVFLLGKMLDFDSPTPRMRSTLIFLSEVITDEERRAHLDYLHTMSLNKMSLYLFNRNDFNGTEPTNPWVGSCSVACDKTRFDLARWHMYEHWLRTIRDEGMVAEFWFFADNSAVGSFSVADRNRLIRYGMARLSGYVNTMFLVSSEWEEAFPATTLEETAQHLQSFNPWRRQASTHCLPGNFDFPEAPWADYMSIQSSITGSWTVNRAVSIATRGLARKPSMSEEFAQGYESGLSRIKAWSVFTAGQAGIGTGAYLMYVGAFAAVVPYYKMDPADSLILSGQAYCMAEPGYHYVVYLPLGGPVTLDLTDVTGSFEAQWYDTRTGLFSSAGTATGGTTPSWVGPQGDDDMVLWLRPLVSGSTPPPRVTGLGFLSRTALEWEPTEAAAVYDVLKGSLSVLRAQQSFTPAINGCLENNGTDMRATDAASPTAGQGVWYLVRAVRSNGIAGTYSMVQPGEHAGRDAQIAASVARCP